MTSTIALGAAAMVVFLTLNFAQAQIVEPNSVGDPALQAELLARAKKDQDVREKLIREQRAQGLSERQFPADILKEMQAIDAENLAWIRDVVDERGWPGKTLVGPDGSHAAWLLVQHSGLDFQKKCLTLLTAAVKAGEADSKDLAYLTDRVLLGEGKKQLYGTQVREVDGKLVPQPVEDEANLDKRRKEVGLPPIAEHLTDAAENYKLGQDKLQPKE